MRFQPQIQILFTLLLGWPLFVWGFEYSPPDQRALPRVEIKQWQFKPQGVPAKTYTITAGRSLRDQLPSGTPCCNGELIVKVATNLIPFADSYPTGVYLPSLGGRLRAKINNRIAPVTGSNYSSIGPIITFDDRDLNTTELEINLEIEGEPNRYSGLSMGTPIIAPVHFLQDLRNEDWHRKRQIPLVESLFLAFCGFFLFLAYFLTRRRFTIHILIGGATLASSFYLLFLSDIPRNWSYVWGTALEAPSKIVFYWGLYLLSSTRASRSRFTSQYRRASLLLCMLFSALSAYFGLRYQYDTQNMLGYAFLTTLLLPILDFSTLHKSLMNRIEYFAPIATMVLATLDFPLTALLWALSLAGIKAIVEHIEFLDRWKLQFTRIKRVKRSVMALASGEVAELEMNQFAKMLRRAMRVKRASIVRATSEGVYEVCGLSGIAEESTGSLVDPNDHDHIQEAIHLGRVVITNNKTRRGKMWETSSCVAIPVPITRTPTYLILLSDPAAGVGFSRQDIPYMNQLSQVLWTNMTLIRDRSLRRDVENRFRALVEKMDPHLHSLVTQNLESTEQKYSAKADRGLIYFDQKEFSTLIERLDSIRAETLGNEIARWVSNAAQKHKGEVRGFYGDAYLLECMSIGEEDKKSVALRTARILWDLAESVPELNKRLLERGVGNVKFRFGGHFGEASSLNLFVLNKNFNTLFGDSVNISQRLQSIANAGEIFISNELAQYLGDEFVLKQVPRSFVKGRKGFIEVFKVIGAVRNSEDIAS